MTPDEIRALAAALADQLAPRLAQPEALLDCEDMARVVGMTPAWVREHADDLGVLRMGAGPRPRLRFDRARSLQFLAAASKDEAPPPSRPRRRQSMTDATLLPIKGGRVKVGQPASGAGVLTHPAPGTEEVASMRTNRIPRDRHAA